MDPIRNILEIIRFMANAHLNVAEPRVEDWVALTSVVGPDGAINPAAKEKIVLMLYNLTQGSIVSADHPQRWQRPSDAMVTPPLYIDLHVVFMANFSVDQYSTGLTALSKIVSYFQQNPYLTRDNARELDPTIDRISFEFASLSPADVHHVMNMLGTKYVPSAFYKLRMISYRSTVIPSVGLPTAVRDSV